MIHHYCSFPSEKITSDLLPIIFLLRRRSKARNSDLPIAFLFGKDLRVRLNILRYKTHHAIVVSNKEAAPTARGEGTFSTYLMNGF